MSHITIHNFGPIEKIENLLIKKVTIFIGEQGSGKSTVAKLISTFEWMEKALLRGDYKPSYFESYTRFRKIYCAYHRIENYFHVNDKGQDITYIGYKGKNYQFVYQDGKLCISDLSEGRGEVEQYRLPQILYIPSERNFESSVSEALKVKGISPALAEFIGDLGTAKGSLEEPMELPIGKGVFLEYNKRSKKLQLLSNGYKIYIEEASSGFQSAVPLLCISKYFSSSIKNEHSTSSELSPEEKERFQEEALRIIDNKLFTEVQKQALLSKLGSRFRKTSFCNIVEEPEQNLYPTSLRGVINSLLEYNNEIKDNRLIITTHSLYLLGYLSLAIQAKVVLNKLSESHPKRSEFLEKVKKIVPIKSATNSDDILIYELKEGSAVPLPCEYGLPSDQNLLNNLLGNAGELFDELLDLEERL
ncbi:AAA family ATPase [Porphyromonas cangingivalis]|uniref:AAA family ATPase n=1 Tax=Porphyromonas cangingivalis TaxID=36874 RepID=UPI00242C1393|nr:AAA family ATPase [Porphyromonas cangingivalis]